MSCSPKPASAVPKNRNIIPKTTVNGHGVFGILSIFLLPINCYGNLAGAI